MKKILFVIPQLNIGGAELQLLKLINGLDKEKYKIYLCNLDKNSRGLEKDFLDSGAEILEIFKNSKFDLSIILKLRRFIKENNIEIVHSFLNNTWPRVACLFLRKKPKIIISERSIDDWWKKWYNFTVDKILLKVTDYATCNSYEIKKFYETKLGKKTYGKFNVIYNGIEIDDYLNCLENRKNLRVRYGIEDDIIVFGIIASLREVKDHITLLKAVKLLKEKGYIFKVFIIGDGILKNSIKDYIHENKLSSFIEMTGNIRPITNILPVVDVGVSSSIREGLSNSIIEFGICGKKVIATKTGGNIELIKENENGNLFNIRSYEELAKIMEKYILKDINCNIKDINKYTKKYRIEEMINRYEAIYDK